ncbi:2-octaprenyl-3-methyl-6-methoxy-1,4-benzoquinol hydroxylase [Halieaceae bacterium IMCC14734]|uniref:2-octaprenyl-3-methyl-6-methoxy-1,4-benzoquinol hydroxylase n=1 Tax=Candidatus Litorirhabdus singularis TaxID=2518993 RepID=A0ABT3TCR1_9GAMM|nr:UbiH/UbiF/VisC/COQ6 family ubiquinone biosynthesis hydroxylase [Candidatus Litorirhabdus singularis]MCX2980076.1 2-octaprenyl-3-methyl-6-methoxy-1,4-benzoquinol hydroxylase [Candidatus Litorirhabdus singularis]
MSNPDYDVVIVGAGIAGSALACALLETDLRVGLVEASPLSTEAPTPVVEVNDFDRRVSAITPLSQALLQKLNVWPMVLEMGVSAYQHMRVWDGDGTASLNFSATELDVPVLGHIIENRVLTAALAQRVLSSGSVNVLAPQRVVGYEALPRGARVELADGTALSTRLLVAADGALSGVRELADMPTREWDYGHHAIVCTVEVERPHQNTAWQRFSSTGPLAFLPLSSQSGRHYCSIVWSQQNEIAEELLALDDVAFTQALGDAIEWRLGQIMALSARAGFPLRQRHAIDYVQPGLALIGDAAHTIHPLAGQGINLGLQDVSVLAEEIMRGVQLGMDPGELALLARYQRRRKGENLLMMAAMDGFKHVFEQQALPLRWLRNTGMRLVGQAVPLKQQLMRHAMGIR